MDQIPNADSECGLTSDRNIIACVAIGIWI